MRLFTGIALAPNVTGKLSAVLDQLRPTAGIKWSPVENLHITCKFIGEWPEDRLEEMKDMLDTVRGPGSIRIAVSRFGFFPGPHQPRSFFADVQPDSGLSSLAAAIDVALSRLGCAPENRLYKPHVTLARIKPSQNIRELREYIAGMTDSDFGEFDCPGFHLYQSVSSPGGSVYRKLATYDLMREKHGIS